MRAIPGQSFQKREIRVYRTKQRRDLAVKFLLTLREIKIFPNRHKDLERMA
jgi:hypothetical protein